MSNQSQTTLGNGCSLEDCYTNIFALTDFGGIQCREYTLKNEEHCGVQPTDDPLLMAFTRCVEAGLLCAWVRCKRDNSDPQQPYNMANFSKALWLFWYGDQEPKDLRSLISDQLKSGYSGNWRVGLSYEIRTILFKALHNVVERCLVQKGFVRLGKWFLQPYRKKGNRGSPQYSINFSFFLHGESTVCASLDVRQLPPVRCLTARHLWACTRRQIRLPVMLAPYGMEGELVGYCRDNDSVTARLLDVWRRFYPLRFDTESGGVDSSGSGYWLDTGSSDACKGEQAAGVLPKFVEVLAGGCRLRYPSCFVLLADNLDIPSDPSNNSPPDSAASPDPLKSPPTGPGSTTPPGGSKRGPPQQQQSVLVALQEMPMEQLAASAIRRVQQDSWLPLKNENHDPLRHETTTKLSWCIRSPSCRAECRCRRPTFHPSQSMQQTPHRRHVQQSRRAFHRRNHEAVHTRSVFDEVDEHCDRNRSPPPLPANDPTMPTLSPQQPAPVIGQAGGEHHGQFQQQGAPGHDPATQLVSGVLSDQTGEVGTGQVALQEGRREAAGKGPLQPPRGIVLDPAKLSPDPALWSLPPASVNPRNPLASWLGERVAEYQRRERLGPLKRPALLRPLAELCPSDTWLLQPEVGDHNQAIDAAANDGYIPACKHARHSSPSSVNMLQQTRQRVSALTPTSTGPSADTYEFNPEEPEGMRSFEATGGVIGTLGRGGGLVPPTPSAAAPHFKPGPSPPDNIFEGEDEEEDNGTPNFGSTAAGSLMQGQTIAGGNPGYSQVRFGNTVGVVQTAAGKICGSGTSLASSTGSGPIGAAELTRMLPTPPSHEATQPSPVDQAVTLGPSTPAGPPSVQQQCASQTQAQQPLPQLQFQHSIYTLFQQAAGLLDGTGEDGARGKLHAAVNKDWYFQKPQAAPFAFAGRYCGGREYSSASCRSLVLRYDHRAVKKQQQQQQAPPTTSPSVVLCKERERPTRHSDTLPPRTPNSLGLQPSGLVPTPSAPVEGGASLSSLCATLAEADSLYLNVILSDSLLNMFKDHNFDSCNICECSMSVQGSDMGLYLPGPPETAVNPPPTSHLNSMFLIDDQPASSHESRKCTCGFSAVMNRHYVVHGNLFYEDEMEVTGMREERRYRQRPGLWIPGGEVVVTPRPAICTALADLLSGPYEEFAVRQLTAWVRQTRACRQLDPLENMLEYRDAQTVAMNALQQARLVTNNRHVNRLDEQSRAKGVCLHPWFYQKAPAKLPDNYNDQIRLLKMIRPLLQEAVGATRLLESTYTVDGPLTWKTFHQLAGRGADESCEPQPLPQFKVTGGDREALLVSPYAVHEWERLSLEPFSRRKDVAFAVACPEECTGGGGSASGMITGQLVRFFTLLSNTYEACKLGRHLPYRRATPGHTEEAFIALSPRNSNTTEDDMSPAMLTYWCSRLQGIIANPEELVRRLHWYTTACQRRVVASLIEFGVLTSQGAQSSHFPVGAAAGADRPSRLRPSSPRNGQGPLTTALDTGQWDTEEDVYLVIYIVNPFTLGYDLTEEVQRLAVQALVGCSRRIVEALPPSWQHRVTVQLVPLDQVVSSPCGQASYLPRLGAMALSTYTATWRFVRPTLINASRTLTGVGPSAEKEKTSKLNEASHEARVFTPAYVLASPRDYRGQWDSRPSDPMDRSSVLFCAYCLSEDQQWLLATCTDERGALLHHATINILIPDRHRRSRTSARRAGLAKLWDFILGVIGQTANPWRLVVGKIGRIGHGELKGWNGLLGRRNLARVNSGFRDQCSLCSLLYSLGCGGTQHPPPSAMSKTPAATSALSTSNTLPLACSCGQEMPSLLSACLVSMEAHTTLRVFPGAVRPEEHAASGLPMTTPRDASVTHILVIPTSTMASEQPDEGQFPMPDPETLFEQFDTFEDTPFDFNLSESDIISLPSFYQGATMGGPVNQQEGAPPDPQDEETNLMQQPLAMGYYISTAAPGPLPAWFWAACPPHQCSRLPACFKAALHLQSSLLVGQEETGPSTGIVSGSRPGHPLDSSRTCDVLRFVLEAYNALSWLTLDPTSNDRRSCLPLHVVSLMQIYQGQLAFL